MFFEFGINQNILDWQFVFTDRQHSCLHVYWVSFSSILGSVADCSLYQGHEITSSKRSTLKPYWMDVLILISF
ncbi:hypothetical protein BSPWISOX_2852 [uncultured Gammaproteobacteria bacterium]|nr:hypothetical protein BSPCLSOX_2628 [uncultured Gammaproteobacteria bacterium]VVH61827.1 hypothetical protein BSPWISOX_2852 [uncultured Gammaproteobacteria bacterium]